LTPTSLHNENEPLRGARRLAAGWRIGEEHYGERALMASTITRPYTVYIDDSTQCRHGKRVVGIGAYIGTVESWARFEADWKGVLRRGPFPYFHTTDFLSRKPPFNNGWSDHQRNEFMERITTTASEYPTFGINAALVCDEYDATFPPHLQQGWRGDPRLFAFFSLLVLLHGMLTDKQNVLSFPLPLHFLIERQRGFIGNAIELFYAAKAKFDTSGVFADIHQGDDQTYPALQAADVLVYEAVRRLVEAEHDPDTGMRKPFEVLRRKDNILPLELRGELLSKYVEFMHEDEELRKKG
jgi:hypothetical protein